MADAIKIDLTGDRELKRVFRRLETKAKNKIGRKGNRAGAGPVLKRMRALAPVGETGNLKRSIGKKFKRYGGVDVVVIGPRIKTGEASGQHAWIVELGTTERFTTGKGSVPPGVPRGIMPAKPFMRPAWAQTGKIGARKSAARMVQEVMVEGRK